MTKKLALLALAALLGGAAKAAEWELGQPIVTYWCGPTLTDSAARQMAEGGFNLVWCTSPETLEVAKARGLRAMYQDGLIQPDSLASESKRAALDALIDRIKTHPALYAYFITDEPNAAQFEGLGKLVAYLKERDPSHLAYINLFPTYATNEQLGNQGDVATAYRAHLSQYVQKVKPALVSYDHYQFGIKKDSEQYFLNLALIRQSAQEAKVPFLNIVQASTWAPASMRIPGPDEVRYLIYTSLAYGAQGISYYIYSCANHLGGLARSDGTPTELYEPVKGFNREFAAAARELQSIPSQNVWHTALREKGCEPFPATAPFKFEVIQQGNKDRGFLIGTFGKGPGATHVVIVNLDYKAEAEVAWNGAGGWKTFDAAAGRWSPEATAKPILRLPPGGGKLLRREP